MILWWETQGLADYKEERHEFQVGFYKKVELKGGSEKLGGINEARRFWWPLDEIQIKGVGFFTRRPVMQTEKFLT